MTHATVTQEAVEDHDFSATSSGRAHDDIRWYVKTYDADNQFLREVQVLATSSAAAWLKAQRFLGDDEQLLEEPTTPLVHEGSRS